MLYLAEKVVPFLPSSSHSQTCSQPIHLQCKFRSTQKEADTLIILYAVALGGLGITIHIYSSDTDLCWRCSEFQSSGQRASSSWTQEINDALSSSSLSTMQGS